MSEGYINIRGARTHNLKNISIDLPRQQLIVVTGLSGSGKSSLAFDTLYAEGQRRYVESLSAYARQFMGRMQKPEVDFIDGIPPAIAIQQRTASRNPRSTVGTTTEVYDYLKLLFARIGKTISPVSGQVVRRHHVKDVVDFVNRLDEGTRLMLVSPIDAATLQDEQQLLSQLSVWQQQGFSRLLANRQTITIDEAIEGIAHHRLSTDGLQLLIDRIVSDRQTATLNRFADSVQTAFFEGKGSCSVIANDRQTDFSERFEADGITFIEPSEHLFDFNNPLGACPVCGGFGNIIGIDPDLVVPDKSLSVYDDAILCWRGEKMSAWRDQLVNNAHHFDFPVHTPFSQLTPEQRRLIWTGNSWFHGLNDFFKMLEEKQYGKIQYRVMLSRFRGKTTCTECDGGRLRREALYVYVNGKNIGEISRMSITEATAWFADLKNHLTTAEQTTVKQLLDEINSRLSFMQQVGLGYLTLDRLSSTLSGGESQRITLAKSLGSSLVGSLYVLDEPSIGLHPRDTEQLISVLRQLRDIGNTVVVVEHDEDIMRAADYLVDIGPKAGRHGGEVVWSGPTELIRTGNTQEGFAEGHTHSFTIDSLLSSKALKPNSQTRHWNRYIEVHGARENNLKNIDVIFPLNVLTVVTGVSGSGKSTLVKSVLYPALKKRYGGTAERNGECDSITGDLSAIRQVEYVDQNPLSKSTRSNPVTYLKAYDEIRKLFAEQQLSHQMGYTAAHFSFNTPGGRCEECAGEGTITVEMQFMADLVLECEHCHGKRFKSDILEVEYRGQNIYDILEMTVDQAIEFFSESFTPAGSAASTNRPSVATDTSLTAEQRLCRNIVKRLQPLHDVGIGYVKLGQSSSTLSGGESQRVKLASFLASETTEPTLFIFDEPTTGLHSHDISLLLSAINQLLDHGHSVIIIEHNLNVIAAADYVIDLGPEGGQDGGQVIFTGTPAQLAQCQQSYTAKFLNR